MAELFWPSLLTPNSSSVNLTDGAGRFVSPFTGTTRTVSRPGSSRLKMSLKFHALQDDKRGALQAFLAGMDGAANRVWCRDHSYVQRGSFPSTELIGNVAFTTTTGWTSSNSEVTISASEGELRLYRTAVAADRYVYYSQITGLTSGAAYVFSAVMLSGKGSEAWALRAGSTAGAATYIDSGQQDFGYAAKSNTIAATTAYVSIFDQRQDLIASPIVSRAIGDYQRFAGVSFSRCFLVNGASQTGSALIVDQLPTSTNGLLLPGDQVQIGDELKIVTAPLNSDGSGNGYLQFSPALRVSPADNDPVIVYRPMGKFLLSENENGWESVPGVFTSAEVSLVEAVD